MAKAKTKVAVKAVKSAPVTKAKKVEKTAKTKGGKPELLATFVRDLSFECPAPALKPLAKGEQQLDFRLSAGARKVAENGDLEQAEVTLHLRAVGTHKTGIPLFVCEMAYSGLVEWKNAANTSVDDVVWEIAPSLVYPKARQVMLQTLAGSGFSPPLPNDIDFAALRKQQA